MPVEQAAKDSATARPECDLADAPCFIERQFPVAKVSMESFKERSAKQSQTLTGLGKWWGRKPLVLVRATILGLLMPASDDPLKDREVFLRLLTMDDDGLRRRKDKSIPQSRLIAGLQTLPSPAQRRFLLADGDARSLRRLTREDRQELQGLVFDQMSYSEKLSYCKRPEHVAGPHEWDDINRHLKTASNCIQELVDELGMRRFGHKPRVGDAFSGAGSIPFEAARIGCDAFASDLSPVASLLSWAALNVVGGGEAIGEKIAETQVSIFASFDKQMTDWGIEHNEKGWRADAYLYCVEVRDPETGWMVPLLPSRVVSMKQNAIAVLKPDATSRGYDIAIECGVGPAEMQDADKNGTFADNRVIAPGADHSTPIEIIRRNLRNWENADVTPRPDDVLQERLYCIRWVEPYYERVVGRGVVVLTESEALALENFEELLETGKLRRKTRHHYKPPDSDDVAREQTVLALLKERFDEWQRRGLIPHREIVPGPKTSEPIRTRGWTHWHHLFNARQLLTNGSLAETIWATECEQPVKVACLLSFSRCADYNAKLSRWHPRKIGDKSEQVFSNQALNPLWNYAVRGTLALAPSFVLNLPHETISGGKDVRPADVRSINAECDLWITDPPYADAVNYHELGEFFLAWYDMHISALFPNWYTDSKRQLAVRGSDGPFRKAMVEAYRRLAENMPANGMQVVMFTHQDASVWADLTMILWASGLSVTAAWCIATETDSALKEGNYVQGTVLLVCRKRMKEDAVFLDEISHRVEQEVHDQLDSMLRLDDESDPNFADADYQLAAYAAALRVLTERPIEEIDPEREVLRERQRGEVTPVEQLIRNAVKIACDHLVPAGIEREIWKSLAPTERFYLRGLEVETHGERRSGVYQELARGFGAAGYAELLESDRANETRLKTASEFGRRMLAGEGFASSLVRQALFAVHQVGRSEQTREGLNWLKTELPDYWGSRGKIAHILDFFAALHRVAGMEHWRKDADAAGLLAGTVRNDHI
ncbi:MAG TPA: anti-phage-associated DUF1156 domain-containing protein [Pirellulales bacterium]|nr:anti-phage-associated DUF1156 domain-containing protein [Pirellulales bacterium]